MHLQDTHTLPQSIKALTQLGKETITQLTREQGRLGTAPATSGRQRAPGGAKAMSHQGEEASRVEPPTKCRLQGRGKHSCGSPPASALQDVCPAGTPAMYMPHTQLPLLRALSSRPTGAAEPQL